MGATSYIAPGGDKLPFFWIYQFQGEGMQATLVAESVDKNKVWLWLSFEIFFAILVFV